MTSELIPIPRSPKYILGIVNIDSNIYPIVDLDVLLSGQKSTDLGQTIVSLIDIKNTIFGIHTQKLPHVVPGTIGDAKGSVKKIPEDWVLGYTEQTELGNIPILNPMKFWIDLGESQVAGPLLDADLSAIDLYPEGEDMSITEETIENIVDEEPVQETTQETMNEEVGLESETSNIEIENQENEIFQLDGVGQKVKEDLLAAGFDSIDKLANASIDDLVMINGVGKKTAEGISAKAKELLGVEEEN